MDPCVHIKGQLTKAVNVLKTKISSAEQAMADDYVNDTKYGQDLTIIRKEKEGSSLHLKSKLKGRARDIIASIELSADNYQEAINLLHNTYNRPDVLRNKLFEQLEAIAPANETPLAQRTTLCKIKSLWLQLKNLKEQPGATGTMRLIRAKFPQSTRQKGRDDHWTVEELLAAFDQVIDRLEVMEDTDPTSEITSYTSTTYYNSTQKQISHEADHNSKEVPVHILCPQRTKHHIAGKSNSPRKKNTNDRTSTLLKCLRQGHRRLTVEHLPATNVEADTMPPSASKKVSPRIRVNPLVQYADVTAAEIPTTADFHVSLEGEIKIQLSLPKSQPTGSPAVTRNRTRRGSPHRK
ncbi:hypothetical protein COOONC_02867 [Cooperia oncophora]